MPSAAGRRYSVTDQLFLWLLTDPDQPVLIGELNTVRSSRGVSLRYAPSWLARGFALSEDLPLIAEEFLPRERDTAAGAVDDARPDRWGERVIRFLDKPPRLSLLEFLYFAGDDRFGALGVSTSSETYLPRRLGRCPSSRKSRRSRSWSARCSPTSPFHSTKDGCPRVPQSTRSLRPSASRAERYSAGSPPSWQAAPCVRSPAASSADISSPPTTRLGQVSFPSRERDSGCERWYGAR